jgi:hypothetical protein
VARPYGGYRRVACPESKIRLRSGHLEEPRLGERILIHSAH